MKVISGKYKGRKLKGYNVEGTRPTMDRVKESLCAMLSPYLKDSNCLDLFAGSGAVGIEFISNGAKKCSFVEINKVMFKVLKDNLLSLNINIENIFNLDYNVFIKTINEKYNIIFLDPPYNSKNINTVLKKIKENNLLQDKGIIVIETENEEIITNLDLIKEKKYGNKKIYIFQKTS